MTIKTYTEEDDFPENIWFADWQPRKDGKTLLKGDVLIRFRDDHATKVLFSIPVGGKYGIKERKVQKIINDILITLNRT